MRARVWTYFIQRAAGGLIKIGKAIDPEYRRRSLEIGAGEPLVLLGVIAGNHEQKLHRRHAEQRAYGEWFRPSDALLADIARADRVAEPAAALECGERSEG